MPPKPARPTPSAPDADAFRAELAKRADAIVEAARGGLPKGDAGAEQHARALGTFDEGRVRRGVAEAIEALEKWFASKLDAHVAALAKEYGVAPSALRESGEEESPRWLREALRDESARLEDALRDARRGATADAPSEIVARVLAAAAALGDEARRVAELRWKERTEKLAAEGEERAVAAIRERADRAATRKAARTSEAEAEEPEEKKSKRRWYHWLLDLALFAAAAYMIKVRFFTKEPPAPEPPPASSAPSASASAPRAYVSPTAVRAGPGVVYAPVESLSAKAPVDVVEVSKEGWAKVRLSSGKQGWVPIDAIELGAGHAAAPDAGHD